MQNQQPKNNIIIDPVVSQNFSKELQLVSLSGRKIAIHENYNQNNIFQINVPQIYQSVPSDYDTYSDTYQKEKCNAIAFNMESTVMVAGSGEFINVFDFNRGQLKKIDHLKGHSGTVRALYFMKSNDFISGSEDSNILVWGVNNNQQWYCKQQLTNVNVNNDYFWELTNMGVCCLIMNTPEDLIISCGWDKSIKFWEKKNEWECSQTLSCDTDVSNSLSLNHSQNQLVSWGKDKQILIFQVTKNKQWKKIQRIQVGTKHARVFFIDDYLTYYQYGEKMEIFELNLLTKQFIKQKEVKAKNQFFCFTTSQEGEVVLENVYLIRKQNQYDFRISFNWPQYWGAMTDNGEYLAMYKLEGQLVVLKQQQ